jgi:hypothetical protein
METPATEILRELLDKLAWARSLVEVNLAAAAAKEQLEEACAVAA